MGLKETEYMEVPQPISLLFYIVIYTHTKAEHFFYLLVGLARKLHSMQGKIWTSLSKRERKGKE